MELLEGQTLRQRLEVGAGLVPAQGLTPHIFKLLLDLSWRRFCIGLRSWRFRSSAGSGPRQEEQDTPADFLVEFRAASLKCQPYPFHLVFGRHFAEGAVHFERRVFR